MHIPFEELKDLEIFHTLMETNYFGYVYCTHYALPHLRKSKKPRIIVVSSLSGTDRRPPPPQHLISKLMPLPFSSYHS